MQRGDEHWAVVEELKQQVLDLTQQVSALQRQLQMQEKVSQVAASIEGLLDKVASACERRAAETEAPRLEELARAVSAVDARARESDRVLREEVLPEIERIEYVDPILNGIIARLTRKCGGNVHKAGVVTVTASSVCGCQLENVVDLTSDSEFWTNDSPDSWIRYDFGGWRVTPTSYSIRSQGNGPGGNHPKSWVLEVSNDGSEGSWEEVDSRENNSDLNGGHLTRNFAVGARPSGAFRFVRLRLTGRNHHGNDHLWICALELFGALSVA